MYKLKITLIFLLSTMLLAGCEYTRLHHAGRIDYDKLSGSIPRYPLKISYESNYPDFFRSKQVYEVLKSHPLVEGIYPVGTEGLDMSVRFEAVTCRNNPTAHDSFLGTLGSIVLLPVILFANPFPFGDQDCQVAMSYRLLQKPDVTKSTTVTYDFNIKHQTQLFLFPLYSSKNREAYQQEYLNDQIAANLLRAAGREFQ